MQQAEPIKTIKAKVNQDVTILGGSIAAAQAAISLAKLGHKVTIINKDAELGGLVSQAPEFYAHLAQDSDEAASLINQSLNNLRNQIKEEKNIKVYHNASLKSSNGQFGNFSLVINHDDKDIAVSAGAIILGTESTGEFCFDSLGLQNPSTYADMAKLSGMIQDGKVPRRVAIVIDFINQQDQAVCARVLSAAQILVSRFGSEVKLYCQNIRVAATGIENLYRRARQIGVIVAKTDSKPLILEQPGKVEIKTEDPVAGVVISEEFDLLVMADHVLSPDSNLINMIDQLRPSPDAGGQYDNIWLLPTAANLKGVFVVGSTRGNSEYRNALSDGLAAAAQIHEMLSNKQIELPDDAAVIDPEKCVLCLTCRRICPHGAISIDAENSTACVSPVSCQRCGICAAECPATAIQLIRYTDAQVRAELSEPPSVTIFACENSALPAAVTAGLNGAEYSCDIQLIRVPCAGKVDTRDILGALEKNAEKVMIIGCHPQSCRYLTGSSRAVNRTKYIGDMLEKAGFDRTRVCFKGIAAIEPKKFLECIKG